MVKHIVNRRKIEFFIANLEFSNIGSQFFKRLICVKNSSQQIVCYLANISFVGMLFTVFTLFATQIK